MQHLTSIDITTHSEHIIPIFGLNQQDKATESKKTDGWGS